MVFGQSSGALLYDNYGRAFAIIVKHGVPKDDSVDALTTEQAFLKWQTTATISAFPLQYTLHHLKAVLKPSAYMNQVIEMLREGMSSRMPGDMSNRATPIDMIYLIDDFFSGEIGKKWLSDEKAWNQLLWKVIEPAAGDQCVATYFLEMHDKASRKYDAIPAVPVKSRGGTDTEKSDQRKTSQSRQDGSSFSNRVGALPDKLGDESLESDEKLGILFLEQALNTTKNPSLKAGYVGRALKVLRRGMRNPEVRRALKNGSEDRDYAAMAGNLGVAEDLGAQIGIGSKEAASNAIFAADALGGSFNAYELAARYAMELADAVSAAGLYARAVASLGDGPRDEGTRDSLTRNFQIAVAKTETPNTKIENFHVNRFRGHGASRWYALAANEPHPFEYDGIQIAQRGAPRNDLAFVSQDPSEWAMPAKNYDNQRYSTLKQINASNVGKLQVAWTFSTGVLRGHEGAPLVIGNMMYVHTPFPNIGLCTRSRTTKPRSYGSTSRDRIPSVIPVMCCDTVNRGLSYE